MRIEFDKMEGAGNDFVLVDNRRGVVPDAAKFDLVVAYSRRAAGIGADGFIFIEPDREYDFSWDFYNADGSRAEMCGNGARCAARFARKIGAAGDSMIFRTIAGPIRAELTDRGAKVQLRDAAVPAAPETIDIAGTPVSLYFLNTGVPHAVALVDDVEKVDVPALGRKIRRHPRFAPAGTNVNFFRPGRGDRLAIRTYERGVENETLACGTGTVAACLVSGAFFGKHSPITALVRSGEELVVHYELENGAARNVFLEGGARLVFSGVFSPPA